MGSLIDRFAVVLVALAAMLWGTDTLWRPTILRHLSSNSLVASTQVVFMEHLILTVCSIPLIWIAWREIRRLTRSEWVAIVCIGVGASALATVLFTLSFTYGHFIETLLLQKTQPIVAILLAALWLRERLAPAAYVLIPIAIFGAYLIAVPDPFHPQNAWADFHIAAALAALGASALWGAATVFGRFALKDVSFTAVTALRFTTGFPALAIVLLLMAGGGGFGQYRGADVPYYLAVALLPGLLAMLLYYRGLASTPASMATLAELAFPITGVLVNLYLVKPAQTIEPVQVVGIVVLWGAIAVLDWFNARQPARLERGAEALPSLA
ncbi:MAG TPA: DMT family transporter [Candidatus Dormibacteraeota bacterium]